MPSAKTFVGEHAQTAFTGGEITPRLRGRFDTELYKKALAYCENWQVTPQGSKRIRGGTLLAGVIDSPVPANPIYRAIPFRLSTGQDLVVVLKDKVIQVWDQNGQKQVTPVGGAGSPSGPNLVQNPSFTQYDGTSYLDPTSGEHYGKYYALDWTADNFNDYWPGFQIAGSARLFQWPAGGPATDVTYSQPIAVGAAGNYAFSMQGGTSFGDSSTPMQIKIGSTPGGNDLLNKFVSPTVPFTSLTSNNVGPFGFTVAAAGTVYLSIELAGGSSGTAAYRISNVTINLLAAAGQVVSSWTAAQIGQVQWAADSANNQMFLVHGNVAPQLLQLSSSGYCFLGPANFTNPPADWQGTNWPSTVTIAKGRLWLGASPDLPSAIWGSRAGNFFDFSPYTVVTEHDGLYPGAPDGPAFGSGGPVNANDTVTADGAISETLATAGIGRWLKGKTQILLGTDLDEHSIFGNGGPLGPTSIETNDESDWGSAPIQAISLGEEVLYVSKDYRKIRSLSYVHDAHAWVSHDITLPAEHLTQPLIQELWWAKDPDYQLFVILQNGQWVVCNYDRGEQIACWYRGTTQGSVLSGCVSHGPSGSVMWLIVQRANGVYLEYLPCSEYAPGYGYMDAMVSVNVSAVELSVETTTTLPAEIIPGAMGGAIPQAAKTETTTTELATAVVSGFGHLQGMLAMVMLDGATDQGLQVVGASGVPGSVIINRTGTVLTVGLIAGTVAENQASIAGGTPTGGATATTLPPELRNPMSFGGGTTQRAKRRWIKCVMRLNNSALPYVNGVPVQADRPVAAPMDAAPPLLTADVELQVTGYDTMGEITITQPWPVRTEVCAIFGSMSVGEV